MLFCRPCSSIRRTLVTLVVAIVLFPPAWLRLSPIMGDDFPVTGNVLRDRLQQRRGTVASGLDIRQAFRQLQTSIKVAVVLDRRIDPTTPIDLETDFVTVRKTVELLAGEAKARVSFTDKLVYVGPPEAAARFRTLTELLSQQVSEQRRDLSQEIYAAVVREEPASWPRLAAPRDLLKRECERRGLTLENPDAVPHDLWRAAWLPRLTFPEFAALVLNQFDLSFRIQSGGRVIVQPLPDQITIEQRHRLPARDRDELIERIAERLPELKINWKRGSAVLSATSEQHERLRQIISGESTEAAPEAGLSSKRFTVTLPPGTQIGQVLTTLQKRQNIEFRFEGLSTERQEQILQRSIELDVKQMPAEEFLQLVFAGTGVVIDLQQNAVVIKAANKQDQ